MQFGLLFSLNYYAHPSASAGDLLAQLTEQICLAEELGFAEVWFTEQHFNPEYGLCPDPLLLLGYAAALTKNIRLGSAVSIAPLYHPLQLAERYTFLDHLSRGRIDIGLGSGFFPDVFAAFNVPFDQRQVARDAVLTSLKDLWATSYDGQHHTTLDSPLASMLLPVQQPHPPFWIATRAIDRVEAILNTGDSVLIDPLFTTFTLPELAHTVSLMRRTKPLPGKIGFVMYTHIGASQETFPYFEHWLGYQSSKNLQQEKGILDLWNAQQQKGTMLCCPPHIAIERLKVIEAAGIDQVLLGIGFGGIPHRDVMQTIEKVALEVIPSWRAAR